MKIFSALAAASLLFLTGCQLAGSHPGVELPFVERLTKGPALYSNSFESAADLADWKGFRKENIKDEAPAGGGARSVFISSGCVGPFPSYTFVAREFGKVDLSVWAKDLAIGGVVSLRNMATDETIRVSIREDDWTVEASQESLSVRAGDSLRIRMAAGGFAGSSMLVTEVEVSYAK